MAPKLTACSSNRYGAFLTGAAGTGNPETTAFYIHFVVDDGHSGIEYQIAGSALQARFTRPFCQTGLSRQIR